MRRCALLTLFVCATLYVGVRTFHAESPSGYHAERRAEPAHHEAHHTVTHHRVLRSGSAVDRRGGKLVGFHDARRHIDMHRNLSGGRRIFIERADHAHIVAEYGRGGYVEHPYAWQGHPFFFRTYYRFGQPGPSRFYKEYRWRGIGYHAWRPRYFPHPAFFIWLGRPWHHVRYHWAWTGWRWYARYSDYYQPYSEYDDASEWLDDFIFSEDFADDEVAYNLQHPSPDGKPTVAVTPQPGPAPARLSDDVRHQLDAEIRYEIAQEEQEAQQDAQRTESDAPAGVAAVFTDTKPHVFLVSHPVDADDPDYPDGCMLSTGDVLRTTTPPEEGDTTAEVTVLASRGGENACAVNSTVSVALGELQEMQNDFRVRLQEGLDKLRKEGGTNGLPALDPAADGTITATYTSTAPKPDLHAWTNIGQAYQEADAAERDVTNEEEQEPDAAPSEPPAQQPPAPIERH